MPPLVVPEGSKPVLFFDTETIGLKPAIVCQLAYLVVEGGTVTTEYDQILKLPPGVKVSPQAQKVHGISTRDTQRKGVDAEEAMRAFAVEAHRVLEAGGRVVAHNSKFDVRAVRETREAWQMVDVPVTNPALTDADTFDTMMASKPHSPLLDKAGRRKAFRLEEWYVHLFGSPPAFARLHNALDDVRVLALCYFEANRLGWW